MAPVIFGFDLADMRWSAFSSREMFSRRWHLRRERFIVYQIAMLICLAAECTATYSLAKYEKLQDHIEDWSGNVAALYNDDIVASEVLTIVFCVFVATLFGADFFFLLFFPKKRYPSWYNSIRKGAAIFITGGVFAAVLMSTVRPSSGFPAPLTNLRLASPQIVVASHQATISGVSLDEAVGLVEVFSRPPLQYNKWAVNIAYVVLLWIGWLATLARYVFLQFDPVIWCRSSFCAQSGVLTLADDPASPFPWIRASLPLALPSPIAPY
ncbi:hypothetical protein DL93DRAFT_2196791 [Clavulina sp. PMI_390]|nr:hypothetical protein DL93DRAFT_2196791 [Clavulina sp. PMI_390]